MDSRVSAVMTPARTISELYCVAKSPEAICVLSPHSDMKINTNPDKKEFSKWSLLSCFACFSASMSAPKAMKTIADAVFSHVIGMMFVMYVPSIMAVPSTVRKASRTPRSRCRCFLVFEDRSRIDSWVLSPSSANPTATSGISMSGIMFRLL